MKRPRWNSLDTAILRGLWARCYTASERAGTSQEKPEAPFAVSSTASMRQDGPLGCRNA